MSDRDYHLSPIAIFFFAHHSLLITHHSSLNMLPDNLSDVTIRSANNRDCERVAKLVFWRGLGKYVLERAIAKAKELGLKQIVLETSSKLIAANRLYAKFGFEPAISDHLASRADQFYKLEL